MLFEDPEFEAWGMRALTAAPFAGADFGECQQTAARIPDGDKDAWQREWSATADRVLAWADASAAAGHRESAHEAYLRVANYLRTSTPWLYERHPGELLRTTVARSNGAFARAMEMLGGRAAKVEIPFEDGALPAWHVRAADDDAIRPLLICNNGYDSLISELWFAHATPALRRGYDVLLLDGPGQGEALYERGLHLRPDWEVVISAVVDAAVELPGVDAQRIALIGWSLGGYLAPRGASGEPRLAALVCDPGQFDIFSGLIPGLRQTGLSDEEIADVEQVDDARLQPIVDFLLGVPRMAWVFDQRGRMVHGLDTVHDVIRAMSAFTLAGRAEQIRCPTLLGSADGDMLSATTPRLRDALTCPVTSIHYTDAEYASGHCEMSARTRVHQRTFDWLDETLGYAR